MADPVPNFAADVNPGDFEIQGKRQLDAQGDAINQRAGGLAYDWSNVNALLDKARGVSDKYLNKAQTGEGVYQGQETALRQTDLGAGANALSPATVGQALIKLSKGGAEQAGQVGAAQGQAQMQAGTQALDMQQKTMAERAAMMQSEMKLQAQKAAINNSVAQVQQGLSLAQTHLTNMFNNAVASATSAQQYSQLLADNTTFTQTMQYIQAGLGVAASASAAGANYLKSNPNSSLAMMVNPSNVWSSQNASPATYNDSTNSIYTPGVGQSSYDTLADGMVEEGE